MSHSTALSLDKYANIIKKNINKTHNEIYLEMIIKKIKNPSKTGMTLSKLKIK